MTNLNFLAPRQTEETEASVPSSTPTPTIHTPSSEDASQPDDIAPRPPRSSPYGSKSGLKSSLSLPLEPDPSKLHRDSSERESDSDQDLEEDEDMGERPPLHRPTDGRSQMPLLKEDRGRPSYDGEANMRPGVITRRSTFRSKSPDLAGATATRKKYTYAAFFLLLSLISFVIQTETAVYIQHELKWNKAYCMLQVTSAKFPTSQADHFNS